MVKIIFFDIDGTLKKEVRNDPFNVDHARGRLIRSGYPRLPSQDFLIHHKFKSSTDYGIAHEIARSITENFISQSRIASAIVESMDQAYFKNTPNNLNADIFPDVNKGLKKLQEQGWKMGIITGNSKTAAAAKLEKLGIKYFFDENLIFSGEKAFARQELLEKAYFEMIKLGSREPGISPFIYVADRPRDASEIDDFYKNLNLINNEIRLLLRLKPDEIDSFPIPYQFNITRFRQLKYFMQIADKDFLEMINLPWINDGEDRLPIF